MAINILRSKGTKQHSPSRSEPRKGPRVFAAGAKAGREDTPRLATSRACEPEQGARLSRGRTRRPPRGGLANPRPCSPEAASWQGRGGGLGIPASPVPHNFGDRDCRIYERSKDNTSVIVTQARRTRAPRPSLTISKCPSSTCGSTQHHVARKPFRMKSRVITRMDANACLAKGAQTLADYRKPCGPRRPPQQHVPPPHQKIGPASETNTVKAKLAGNASTTGEALPQETTTSTTGDQDNSGRSCNNARRDVVFPYRVQTRRPSSTMNGQRSHTSRKPKRGMPTTH